MKKRNIIIFFILLGVLAFTADSALAVWTWGKPLVPCGVISAGGEGAAKCQRCDLLKLLKNLIDFVLIGLMPVAAGLLLTFAGFLYLTGGAIPSSLTKAKGIFTGTISGVAVISLAWLLTNTLIVNLAKGAGAEAGAPWTTVQCINPIDQAPGLPPGLIINQETCKNIPRVDGVLSGGGEAMKSCFLADPEIARLVDTNQIYTGDRSHKSCNSTNGQPLCEACSHGPGCHYSGASGTSNVEAIDFNAKGGSEYELCRALTRKARECGADFVNYEGNHTHVSTKACTRDAGRGNPCY